MATCPKTCFFASATYWLPGPDDHVHRLQPIDAVGQRGDRLRTAEAVDLGDAELVAGGQQVAVVGAGRRRRHADDDLLDAGRLRGADGHEQGGGVRGRAAGAVDADAMQRPVAEVQLVTGSRRASPRRGASVPTGTAARCTAPAGSTSRNSGLAAAWASASSCGLTRSMSGLSFTGRVARCSAGRRRGPGRGRRYRSARPPRRG